MFSENTNSVNSYKDSKSYPPFKFPIIFIEARQIW